MLIVTRQTIFQLMLMKKKDGRQFNVECLGIARTHTHAHKQYTPNYENVCKLCLANVSVYSSQKQYKCVFGAPCNTVRSLFSEFAHLWRGSVLLILLLFFIIFSVSLSLSLSIIITPKWSIYKILVCVCVCQFKAWQIAVQIEKKLKIKGE